MNLIQITLFILLILTIVIIIVQIVKLKEKKILLNKAKEEIEALQTEVSQDGLTGLYTQKRIYRILRHEINRAKRQGNLIQVIFIDINLFKKINDKHDHAKGDEILIKLSNVLLNTIRQYSDFVGRCGGDEFMIILPNISTDEALTVAKKLSKKIDKIFYAPDKSLSVSMGIAQYDPNKNSEKEEDVRGRADQAMYSAKNSECSQDGKNKICIYSP